MAVSLGNDETTVPGVIGGGHVRLLKDKLKQ